MKEPVHEIKVYYPGHGLNLKFQRFYLSDQIERIKVFGADENNYINVESDRPEKRKMGNGFKIRRVKANWKIISEIKPGMLTQAAFIDALFTCLEKELDNMEDPRFTGFSNYKSW